MLQLQRCSWVPNTLKNPRYFSKPCNQYRRGKLRSTCNATASDGAAGYAALTEKLVGFSSLPFTFIVVPQLIQNNANIMQGQFSALSAISWVGWCAGLSGNALMCTYFASKQERMAVKVQLLGIASSILVLAQLWWAQVMPTKAFAGALAASAAVAIASLLQAQGKMSNRSWMTFEALVSAVGVAAVPQVGASHGR
jgi:hypothetical protein